MARRWKAEYKSPGAYDVEQRPGETELQYYRRLAKVADQRLVRLEKLTREDPLFKGARKFAYAKAVDTLEIFGDAMRFNTKPPEDRRLFKEKIMAMRYFLTAPTSTKKGIIETYQQRANTLNERYGTNFTWKDLADYFDKGLADKMMKDGYGSKTALYAIGTIRRTQEAIVKGIEQNTNVTMEGPVTDAALAILRKRSAIPGTAITSEQKKEIRKRLKKQA